MGIFRRRVRPVPLQIPREAEFALPDVRILTRMPDDVARVREAAAEAANAMMQAKEPDGGLTAALAEQWWPDAEAREHAPLGAIYGHVLMGYAYAAIEDSQDHAVASETNPLIHTCLAWDAMHIPDEVGDANARYHCQYALRAGYYLGRKRELDPELVVPGLVANCDVHD